MLVQLDASRMHELSLGRGVGTYLRFLGKALEKQLKQDELIITEKPVDLQTKPDVVHYPYFDLFFHTLHLRKGVKTVVTIHDVIPLLFPKQYKPGIKGSFRFMQQLAGLRQVDAVITDSEASKKDIVKHLSYSEGKIFVIPLAPNEHITKQPEKVVKKILGKYGVTQPYFLYVGDMNYNKNLPALVRSFSQIGEKHQLVLVGRALNNTGIPEGKALHSAIEQSGASQRILIIDSVGSDQAHELAALFSGALAYVQPSLYEGFGLSILDAMQCGTIVVSSRSSSLPEVAGNAAVYFNPKTDNELLEAMRTTLTMSPAERKTLIKLGEKNVGRFSWSETAKKTINVYRQVMDQS